jgi:hypothetical protein
MIKKANFSRCKNCYKQITRFSLYCKDQNCIADRKTKKGILIYQLIRQQHDIK